MKTTKKYGKKQDLALTMWVKLARAYTTFSKKSLENIRGFNLTEPQFSVLESLGHLGSMKIGTLCTKQLVSGGNMTLVVDNLEKEGLVERIYNKEDRRTITVQLTPKGLSLFEDIFSQHAKHIEKLASVLTEKEQEELAKLLKKLGCGLSGTK
jgi:MarR family 2-MHQ and catechol resistance regulon transcriptional repressor